MECAKAEVGVPLVPPPPAPVMEASGDSEVDLEPDTSHGGRNCDDGDDTESCSNGYVVGSEDEHQHEDEGDGEDEEKVMTWSAWIAMGAEWVQREEEERVFMMGSGMEGNEEENRLFWETCLASGHP